MKKTSKPSHSSGQQHLIEPPVVVDFQQLLAESKLSENEQGIVKRRLIENRDAFGKMLQRLLARQIKQETSPLDMPQSLKNLEENEGREIRRFDSVAKILSRDFPELLQFILAEYQVEAQNSKALIALSNG
ncbi:MAG: hypothetical protein DRR19_33230 [Candidatus Parabeggiatoa sp. nov. 1]|nr:MAG: hypothetical protein DRR19_33230 [Gammaproteobacteria bacterium]